MFGMNSSFSASRYIDLSVLDTLNVKEFTPPPPPMP